MTFKTRVAVSFGLFILLTAGLGAGLMVNSFREEGAFHAGRNALRSQFISQETDYFINRKIKAVETYVLLGEDLEEYVIQEMDGMIEKKFDVWTAWVKAGDASLDDLKKAQAAQASLRAVEGKIMALMEKGAKAGAIRLVGDEYRPAAKRTREVLKDLVAQKVREAMESESVMHRVVRQSHMTSIAGILLAIILGVVLAMNLYNSVMLPMKVLFMWSDQIAKGHLHVSLDIPGNNEMSRLAGNFNEMVQNLSRQSRDQVDRERARMVLERQKERELEVEKEIEMRRTKSEEEDVSTLEDAVEGFREILDIMGAPGGAKGKKKG